MKLIPRPPRRIEGNRTVQANVTLGFRPDKAAIDVDHHLLAIENQ